MFFALVTCALCIGVTLWYYLKLKPFQKVMEMPGPPGIPILGNVFEIGNTSREWLYNMHAFMIKYGDNTWIKFFEKLVFLTRDPRLLEFIMSSTKHISKSEDYTFLHCWLGHGLLVSDGQLWKSRRRIITPTFHFKILEQFTEIFDSPADVLINKLKNCDDGVINIYPFITRHSLDVICETAMGTSVNAQNDTESQYVHAVRDICGILLTRAFSAWKQFDVLFHMSSDYRKLNKCLKTLHGFTRKVIQERRLKLSNQSEQNKREDDDIGIKKKTAFLDLLLTATVEGVPLNDDEIQEEVDTFMFEGHDTTSSGTSFCLYAIANHPEVQEKIVEELQVIFHDDKTRAATYKDLNEMKYLELVLKESLRLYPPVPYFSREFKEDVEFDGMLLPKGLTVTMNVFSLHRNPDIFADPEKFDPDRFLPENIHKNPYVYLPFSAGTRNCIGQKFAMLEMKATISKILRHFELSTAGSENEVIITSELVLKSENGIKMKLKPRN